MMLGFTWDVPGGELSYQAPVPVHVIKEAVWAGLTPALEPPPVVIRKRKWVVYFDYDSAELSESEKRKLTGIRSAVRVKGYASPEGSEEYNLRLSKQRAKNVAEFLKRRGVRVLEIKGLGEKSCSFPPETWARCRKVEVEEVLRRERDRGIEELSRRLHELEKRVGRKEKEVLCVRARRLNIRLYPLDGKVIGIYKKGAKVEVRDRIGGWVRTEEGWVSERWLERCEE